MKKYILIDKQPVEEPDTIKWGVFFEQAQNRIVKKDKVGTKLVSTIFLGLDHNFNDDGPPILFETMVFEDGDWQELDCVRYATWDEALIGHEKMVTSVKELIK